MNFIINEVGDTIKAKDWKNTEHEIGQIDKSPFGIDYHLIVIPAESELHNLLKIYDESIELSFYFYRNILYIAIDSLNYYYIIGMEDDFYKNLRNQILIDNKVLFLISNEKNDFNIFYGYEIKKKKNNKEYVSNLPKIDKKNLKINTDMKSIISITENFIRLDSLNIILEENIVPKYNRIEKLLYLCSN